MNSDTISALPLSVDDGLVLPPGHRVWGHLPGIHKDLLRFYLDTRREYGDFTRLRIGMTFEYYFIAHPNDVERVLQKPVTAAAKGMFWKPLKKLLGEGLLTSDGEEWRQHRRIMQPAFHRKRHTAFAGIISHTTGAMLRRWEALAHNGEPIDVTKEMMRLTLQNAGLTIFGTDLSAEAEEMGEALSYAVTHVNIRSYRWLSPPHMLRFKQAMRTLYRVIDSMIEQRRGQLASGEIAGANGGAGSGVDPTAGHDLLTTLLLTRDETTGQGMTTRELRDELMTFIFTGHETTAIALTWTWHLLSLHPEVERRLYAEVSSVLNGRAPVNEDLPNLPYTRMIIQETMRLYPPVWALSRHFIEEEEIRGHTIPKNAPVVVMPYVTHRHPEFWDNPEGFDPERFTEEKSAGRPKFAYFPFGGGPRQCLGNHFALMEAQLIVASVAQRFRLHALPGHLAEVAPWVSLRPHDDLLMTLHERPY